MNSIKEYEMEQKVDNYEYLNSLMYPETSIDCRIPSKYPTPTCSIQIKSSFIYSPRDGETLLINPYFLYLDSLEGRQVTSQGRTYTINCMTTGLMQWNIGNWWWEPFVTSQEKRPYLNQSVVDLYSSYRLVSASLNVEYVSPVDIAKGFIYGGVLNKRILDVGEYLSGSRTYFFYEGDSLTYKVLKNLPTYRETGVINKLRLLYYPLDNNYESFKRFAGVHDFTLYRFTKSSTYISLRMNTDCFEPNFNWFVSFQNVTSRMFDFKFDMCCNFELIPKMEYTPFLPIGISNESRIDKRILYNIIKKVQDNSIQIIYK